jgi:uncharacterized tellurite resistance protein B-like protein
MTTFFEHQRTSFKRNYLRTLITLAALDGTLDEVEKTLLQKIGLKRGLKEWQITQLLQESTPANTFLPESLSNRMEMLYDLMQIIHADSHVNTVEIEFMASMIEAFKLRPELIGQLMELFRNGVPPAAEWREFAEFVCEALMKENADRIHS